jgi:asparagine synthase (glutamine-hydrolysing)
VRLEPDVGLANARLSIIDIAGGRQPISNEDGTIHVVQNGEVFNYRELREELEAKGHRFKTRSDTEVLVHIYEEEGLAFPERLNGQFAIAIWDARKRRLVVARDHVGIAPLYYTETDGRLLFASEVRALTAHPGVTRRPDPEGLQQLFTFWSPVPPRTVFAGIHELPPGHLLTAGPGLRPKIGRWAPYYSIPGGAGAAPVDAESGAERIRARLEHAVRLRLRADLPVGAYLSGGLDSSITAALAAREVGANLHTFSVTFADQHYDESSFQEEMVRRLGTCHQALHIDAHDLIEAFPAAVLQAERPVLRTAPVPLYLLSRHVRQAGYKVVLTGEGADEVFAGYEIFKEAKIRRWWARNIDSEIRPRLLEALYGYQHGNRTRAGDYWRRFFRRHLEKTWDPYYSHRPRWTNTGFILSLLDAGVLRSLEGYDPIDALPDYLDDMPPDSAPLGRAQYLEMKLFLNGYLLSSQGDRMLMANAVEGRFPFLDPELIAEAGSLPARLKLPGLKEKALLKRACRDLVPEQVIHRRKQPYRAPGVTSLLRAGAVPDYAAAALAPDAITAVGLFDPAKVSALVAKCRARARDQLPVAPREDMAFLAILSTQILFGEQPAPPAPPTDAWWAGAERSEEAVATTATSSANSPLEKETEPWM